MERKEYQLMCTYVKRKYFISTMYRQSSAMIENMWYFETIAWEWDDTTKTRGAIVEMDDSGISEESAMDNHLLMAKKLIYIIESNPQNPNQNSATL